MREVCDRHGALFVLDKIMYGIGRTGKIHAWQWEGLSSPPDIQVNGTGLSGSSHISQSHSSLCSRIRRIQQCIQLSIACCRMQSDIKNPQIDQSRWVD
jgi:acetylornithine/succinyldiaminopimelate/putrescine aminotransferase